MGFGCLIYCSFWSLGLWRLNHFKLLRTQDLNTVLTRVDEVPVILKVSAVSRVEGRPRKAHGVAALFSSEWKRGPFSPGKGVSCSGSVAWRLLPQP